MIFVIKITFEDGKVQYVQSEYGITEDLDQARIAHSKGSSTALVRRWVGFGSKYGWMKGMKTVEAIPAHIVIADTAPVQVPTKQDDIQSLLNQIQ